MPGFSHQQLRFCGLLCVLLCAPLLHAGFGFQATDGAFIIINHGGGNLSYRLTPSTGSEDPFDNYDFDNNKFIDEFYNYATNPIVIKGLIARTFEDGGDDVIGVNLFWRQYEIGQGAGLFNTQALAQVASLGGGIEEYQLLQPINLTVPPHGNISGKIVFEMYLEAVRDGGGTVQLEGRGASNPYKAFYTGFAVPEPGSAGLILLGLFTLRHLHQRRLKARKAASLVQS